MLAKYLQHSVVERHDSDPRAINDFLRAHPQNASGTHIESLIGIGAHGAVFRVENPNLGKFALKIGATREEIAIHTELSRLGCGVPKIHYSEDATLVMDLFATDFRKAHRKQPHIFTAAFFGKKLTEILQPIHRAGFMHCDISPSQLMVKSMERRFSARDCALDPTFDCALSDWGLAQRVDTPHVQIYGNANLSHRVAQGRYPQKIDDLYAVFFSMCSLDPRAHFLVDKISVELFGVRYHKLNGMRQYLPVKERLLESELHRLPAYLRRFARCLLTFREYFDAEYVFLYKELDDILLEELSDGVQEAGEYRKRKSLGSDDSETRTAKKRRFQPFPSPTVKRTCPSKSEALWRKKPKHFRPRAETYTLTRFQSIWAALKQFLRRCVHAKRRSMFTTINGESLFPEESIMDYVVSITQDQIARWLEI